MAGAIVIKTYIRLDDFDKKPVIFTLGLGAGADIGFLPGLIGVGGGIFLSPLILFLGSGTIREIAAVSFFYW